METKPEAALETRILTIRGQRVMLDAELARLYGVSTSRLNEQVRRNHRRFPEDFMFRLTNEEVGALISQIAISKGGRGGRRASARFLPYAFTEHGVAMLSSVLNSERAIQVNISIMRAFGKLQRALASSPSLATRMRQVEERLSGHEAVLGEHALAIRAVFDDIRQLMKPPPARKPRRRRPPRKAQVVQIVAKLRN